MNLKTHMPLAIAALVISGTQVLCTAWLVNRLHREVPDSYEPELHDMGRTLEKIEQHTRSIDVRLMPTSEQLEHYQRERQRPKQEQYYMLPQPRTR